VGDRRLGGQVDYGVELMIREQLYHAVTVKKIEFHELRSRIDGVLEADNEVVH